MICSRCKEPGKKFTTYPSRKRNEFVEHYCPKCLMLEKYERAQKTPIKTQT